MRAQFNSARQLLSDELSIIDDEKAEEWAEAKRERLRAEEQRAAEITARAREEAGRTETRAGLRSRQAGDRWGTPATGGTHPTDAKHKNAKGAMTRTRHRRWAP